MKKVLNKNLPQFASLLVQPIFCYPFLVKTVEAKLKLEYSTQCFEIPNTKLKLYFNI